MKKKIIIKWTLIGLTSIVVLILAIGIYVYSLIPPNIGKPIILQENLFKKPKNKFVVEEKYLFKSATELAEMIRTKKATSVQIVTTYLNHIKNNNWKYNALIWLRENEALEEAKLADIAVEKGDTLKKTLLGVPITIKEMFWVKGSPSTMNAKMFGFIAPEDAVIVKQIKKSGAIILGTTNVPFMLSDFQTQGEVYPTANNPYDTTRTPGGSTGGGAAALAAGFTTLELGSDLGGSIRVPSAFCGLYGLKPTFGTVNVTQGVGPDTTTKYTRFSMASPGPLARNIEDLTLAWNIIRNTPMDERFQEKNIWKPITSKSINQYKIAWVDNWESNHGKIKISKDVKDKLFSLIDSLKNHGVELSKTAPNTYDEMMKSFYGSFASMMAEGQPWALRKLIAMDFTKMDDGSGNFEAFNEAINDETDKKWEQLQTQRKTLIKKWEAFFEKYDFFICPITYGEAFKKCPQGTVQKGDNNGSILYMEYVPYAPIYNATGHPCLIIPMGLNKNGMPIAIQVVGANYSEDKLLYFAKTIKNFTQGFQPPKQD